MLDDVFSVHHASSSAETTVEPSAVVRSEGLLMRPRAAVVNTRLASSDRAIMAAEKIPKFANSPIGESAMTRKPAMSEVAEPSRAKPHAPPTAARASLWVSPFSLPSR